VLASLTGLAVINAGVPGDTTSSGLQRLPEVLAEHKPRLVLLCLGGNDMLRQQPAAATENNLRLLVQTIRASGAEVVLIGVPEPGCSATHRIFTPASLQTCGCRLNRTSSTTC